jgi:hypothetical protein
MQEIIEADILIMAKSDFNTLQRSSQRASKFTKRRLGK